MKKILIIDDEERILEIYIRTFVEAGFIVRRAKNAWEATNILIREDMDLVLLDIRMPNINGKTIFEIIQEYNPNIKVIVFSVYPINVQKQMVPLAKDFYDKSEGPLNLLEKVTNALV